jgi:hypothetical protein
VVVGGVAIYAQVSRHLQQSPFLLRIIEMSQNLAANFLKIRTKETARRIVFDD